MSTTTDYRNVRSTPWAEGDRKRYAVLSDALPAVLETVLDDWQARVDTPGGPTPYTPHANLSVIRALRYEVESEVTPDGVHRTVSKPAEPREELTYLVVTDGVAAFRQATETVQRYLEAERPGTSWGFFAPEHGTTLVLDGREQS